jgi:hypothetical protein
MTTTQNKGQNMKSIYDLKFVRVTSDNYSNQLMTKNAYNIIRCQLSSGDFACHKVKAVSKVEDIRGLLGSKQAITKSMVLANDILNSKPVETKWRRGSISSKEMIFNGVRISRSDLQNGGHFYYVHWMENAHYAAPHSKMSHNFRSLKSAKQFAMHLLEQQAEDPTVIAAFPSQIKECFGC